MSASVRHRVDGTATTMRIRTRLGCTSADMTVLIALGRHFERLADEDLASAAGPGRPTTRRRGVSGPQAGGDRRARRAGPAG
ncbi:MAG: hypothetical protein ACRDVP_09250 [Acidimicrobiales bacterium]